jgi:hypothetical protein
MGQFGDFAVPKDRDAVFIHGVLLHLPDMLVNLLGVLQGLPRVLLPGLVILLFMGIGGGSVSMGGTVVQIGRALMILVMRSVLVASRHL